MELLPLAQQVIFYLLAIVIVEIRKMLEQMLYLKAVQFLAVVIG